MSDLVALTSGGPPVRQALLATAFPPAEVIRPATAGSAAAASASIAPHPRTLPISRAGTARRPATTRSATTATPDTARPAGALLAPAEPVPLPSGYLPAPPPISIRREIRAAAPPPIPASARSGPAPLVQGPGGTLRRSLVETSAALFRDLATATSANDNNAQGLSMTEQNFASLSVVRPSPEPSAPTADASSENADTSLLKNPRLLQELVDRVVDSIECRVVDELERRGRRHPYGAF